MRSPWPSPVTEPTRTSRAPSSLSTVTVLWLCVPPPPGNHCGSSVDATRRWPSNSDSA